MLDRDTWLAHEVPRHRFGLTRTRQKHTPNSTIATLVPSKTISSPGRTSGTTSQRVAGLMSSLERLASETGGAATRVGARSPSWVVALDVSQARRLLCTGSVKPVHRLIRLAPRAFRSGSRSPAHQLLMDLLLRSRRGGRAPTVQQRKCEQQAYCSGHLPVAGMRGLRAGCAAA